MKIKSIINNSLKALCYVLVFYGLQLSVNYVVQVVYGFQAGYESAMNGVELDEATFTANLQVYLQELLTWITLVSGGLTILVLWIFFAIRKKKLFREVRICGFDKKKILPIIILGIALSFLIAGILNMLPLSEELLASYAEASKGLGEGNVVVRILAVVIMAPLVEEIVFRGLVLSRLKRAMKTPIAIIVSSLIFGIMHGHPLWIAYTSVVGTLFAVMVERTKSLSTAILLHMALNSVSVWAQGFEPTGILMYIVTFISLILVVGCIGLIFIKPIDESEEKCVYSDFLSL